MTKWIHLLSISVIMQLGGKPLTPEESIAAFRFESPDLKATIVAAEPEVIDPVAMCFDEKGRIFVVENRRYPNPGKQMPTGPKVGEIARLEDKDGDGRFETRTTFAKGFTFPNGILPWKGGFYVTDAPQVYYLKDTDDDGVADINEVIFTGFGTSSSSEQLRVASPTLGPDGWVYLTSGLSGGKVTSPKHPNRKPVEANRKDWRFHPDTLEIQSISGTGQFGQAFDHLGRRFVCDNRHPIRWVVFSDEERSRNPNYPGAQAMMDLAGAGSETPLFPISPDTTAAGYHTKLMHNLHAGTFTSCSGLAFYSGDELPNHRGNFFICEPAQNLVHSRYVVETDDTLTSQASAEGREFLASPDQWFRPVFALNGPDGALYICDMYRKYIDHPNYLPRTAAAKLDFDAGKQHGRIWMITSCSKAKPKPLPAGNGVSRHVRDAIESRGNLEKLSGLAHKAVYNEWFRTALMGAVAGKELEFLKTFNRTFPAIIFEDLARTLAKSQPGALTRSLVDELEMSPSQSRAVILGAGLKPTPDDLKWAKLGARNNYQSLEKRMFAVRMVGKFEPSFLLQFIHPTHGPTLYNSAIQAVAASKDVALGSKLLELVPRHGQGISSAIIDALTKNKAHHPTILDAIETGKLPIHLIQLNQRRRFNNNNAVKERAGKLFQDTVPGDRMKVFEEYKGILAKLGDPKSGKAVYERTCASCHKFNGTGHDVGPDLTGLKNQPADALLLHILVPNKEVYPNFTFYQATTIEEEVHAGILSSENFHSITLKLPLGQEVTFHRQRIQSLKAMPISLMPDGLEQSMTKQEMRDLLAYIKN